MTYAVLDGVLNGVTTQVFRQYWDAQHKEFIIFLVRVSIAKWTKQSANRYTAFDGRLYLERRPDISPCWHARSSIQNHLIQKTTRTSDLSDAKDVAGKWFLNLRQHVEQGIPVAGRTFATAAAAFLTHHEHTLLPIGESNERKIRSYRDVWNVLRDFIDDKLLTELDIVVLEALCLWRKSTRNVSDKTLRRDIGLVRLVLKFAQRQRWIDHLPLFPQLTSKPVSPDWFSPKEWTHLLATSRQRILDAAKTGNASSHIERERKELHAFILAMGHGCIRVDECLNLRWNDLTPEPKNEALPFRKKTVLLRIRRGKTGKRTGIGTFGTLRPMDMLRELHPDALDEDKIFSTPHPQTFRKLLEAANLRVDTQGRFRNAKTIRHTSLRFRFLYQPEIRPHELAVIGGTSSKMLEDYYLRHLTAELVQDRLTKQALECL